MEAALANLGMKMWYRNSCLNKYGTQVLEHVMPPALKIKLLLNIFSCLPTYLKKHPTVDPLTSDGCEIIHEQGQSSGSFSSVHHSDGREGAADWIRKTSPAQSLAVLTIGVSLFVGTGLKVLKNSVLETTRFRHNRF